MIHRGIPVSVGKTHQQEEDENEHQGDFARGKATFTRVLSRRCFIPGFFFRYKGSTKALGIQGLKDGIREAPVGKSEMTIASDSGQATAATVRQTSRKCASR
ncbi:hypothetical protein PGT21_029561 [Puccinia graminis f. sp. tritici]|uniref:Uncharacterized protein n=1 Tax=Puccinia graminis f. sp. tritici TaxID=56615 RepID=A0A5B0MYE5_PUCGR|nr:hypothetical protein PGT21_029561 [Puccinia graminis f. sp. tritici]KAA1082011.1 hypothetical protein PGTUg99_032591 [Puccinia graminis f. sp. tritici]